MSDSNLNEKPKTQTALGGGPPRPPKKTARGLDNEAPDPRKHLTAAQREEIRQWLAAHKGESK